MRLHFLELPSEERRLYIGQAAAQRNVPPVMLEKDFWVCWILGVLFESRFADVLVFKGGTSLSKVFAVIDRFSEDIDLSLAPSFLGLADTEPPSRTQANQWMKKRRLRAGRLLTISFDRSWRKLPLPFLAAGQRHGSSSPSMRQPTRLCSCFTSRRRSQPDSHTSNAP
jgi:hypothetical protein